MLKESAVQKTWMIH